MNNNHPIIYFFRVLFSFFPFTKKAKKEITVIGNMVISIYFKNAPVHKVCDKASLSNMNNFLYLFCLAVTCREKKKDRNDSICTLWILERMIEISPKEYHIMPILFVAEEKLYLGMADESLKDIQVCKSIMETKTGYRVLYLLISFNRIFGWLFRVASQLYNKIKGIDFSDYGKRGKRFSTKQTIQNIRRKIQQMEEKILEKTGN